jgi:hypothetical protein
MKPYHFNKHCELLKGNGSTVADLPILPMRYSDMGEIMVTCWRLTWGDLLRMIWARQLYMVVIGRKWPATMLIADPQQVGLEQIRDEDYEPAQMS